MESEKIYKLFAPAPVAISGLYLYLFLVVNANWGQKPAWVGVAGILFLPFVLLSLCLGIFGIVLVFKAKKEKRQKMGLLWATLCYFTGPGCFVVILALLFFGLFQIAIFNGAINLK